MSLFNHAFQLARKEEPMNQHRLRGPCIGTMLPLLLCAASAVASPKSEIKGAAILDHPCGTLAVKHMGLVHAGKMDAAVKLGTKEMQEQWKAMSAADKTMMSGMMKEMSQSEEQYSADIKSNGVLLVDGPAATLTVKKTTKDKNGTSTSTMREEFKLDGGRCLLSR